MITLDIDDHDLHILQMLAGGHGLSLEEYLQLVIAYHCMHLERDTDRGLAFATVQFLQHQSIPELTAVLLNNAILGYEILGDADGKANQ